MYGIWDVCPGVGADADAAAGRGEKAADNELALPESLDDGRGDEAHGDLDSADHDLELFETKR